MIGNKLKRIAAFGLHLCQYIMTMIGLPFLPRPTSPRLDSTFLLPFPIHELSYPSQLGTPITLRVIYCRSIRASKFSYPISIVAVLCVAFISVAFCTQELNLVSTKTLNYAPVVVGIILTYALGFRILSARTWLAGPINYRCATLSALYGSICIGCVNADNKGFGLHRPNLDPRRPLDCLYICRVLPPMKTLNYLVICTHSSRDLGRNCSCLPYPWGSGPLAPARDSRAISSRSQCATLSALDDKGFGSHRLGVHW
jgi:hypothetical protein